MYEFGLNYEIFLRINTLHDVYIKINDNKYLLVPIKKWLCKLVNANSLSTARRLEKRGCFLLSILHYSSYVFSLKTLLYDYKISLQELYFKQRLLKDSSHFFRWNAVIYAQAPPCASDVMNGFRFTTSSVVFVGSWDASKHLIVFRQ